MKKILLVEDNETIVMGLKYSLEQENFQVISALNVEKAKDILNKETIDLILLDVTLPDGNGFELCKYIKQKLDADVVEFYPEKINASKFINEIIQNLEIPIEIKNQNIVVEGKENSYFEGDYKWQQEAVTNVVKNCIEHNKDGGNIFIKYEENNLYTKISIKDEGEGISKEDLKHIFERFYKGKNSSENSVGIGLALAKSIIEKNNGMINCRSEVGKGTEFVIKYMKS